MTNNDWRAELAAKKAVIKATLDDMGLSIYAKFVPFSQSRAKNDKHKTLNWTVALRRDGRDVITFDYSAGIAHCPGYAVKHADASFQGSIYENANGKPYVGTTRRYRSPTPAEKIRQYREQLAAAECETGYPMQGYPFTRVRSSLPIMPDPVEVVCSLVMDSTVLDSGGFESWAADFGYDPDSRKAYATYQSCVETALKLRAAIGDAGLERLRTAYADY